MITNITRKKHGLMQNLIVAIIFSLFSLSFLNGQVQIAPADCYPQFADAAAMDDAAAASNADTPFGTWVAAHAYAVANGISTIDFAPGTYLPGTDGLVSDWGNASTGPILPSGMTVNGNGAVIDNSGNGSSQICFATIGGDNVTVDGLTWIEYTGNSNGALGVAANTIGWTISNCNFDHSDWAGDALYINLGATGMGTVTGCNFYNNIQSTGSALNILGSSTTNTDLDIINSTFTCNLRIVSGGAVKIEDPVNVDFMGCSFSGNEANASIGGAVVMRNGADVEFTNCNFDCNLTSGGTTYDGGALAIESNSTVSITGSNFIGNGGDNSTSSPVGPMDGVGDPTYGYTRYGGAIYNTSHAPVTITNCTFHDNVARKGGGIYLGDQTEVTITSTHIENNYSYGTSNSNDGGGGIFVDCYENQATGAEQKTYLMLDGCTLINNKAESEQGGGLHIQGSENSPDTDDTAGDDARSDEIILKDSEFCNNPEEDAGQFKDVVERVESNGCWLSGSCDDFIESSIVLSGTNDIGVLYIYNQILNGPFPQGGTFSYGTCGAVTTVPTFTCPTCFTSPVVADDCSDQGSIGGIVWDDTTTPNGDQSNGGSVLGGVTVNLLADDGVTVLATVTTAADGSYFFGGLENGGCYYIQIVPPAGYNATYQDDATAGTTNDSDISAGFLSQKITICTNCGNSATPNATDEVSNWQHYDHLDAGLTTIVLPVEWSEVRVQQKDCEVEISWKTEMEINNEYFEVLASDDNRTFEVIARINGYGNTVTTQTYLYVDKLTSDRGQRYYKIMQVDYDGNYSYSATKAINLKSCNATQEFKLYPTMTNDVVSIEYNGLDTNEASLVIYNTSGQKMKHIDLNHLIMNGKMNVSLKDFNAGLYWFKIGSSDGTIETYRIIKL